MIKDILKKLKDKKDLQSEEMQHAVESIMTGEVEDKDIEIAKSFTDLLVSGCEMSRPEFNKMLSELNLVDGIIFNEPYSLLLNISDFVQLNNSYIYQDVVQMN